MAPSFRVTVLADALKVAGHFGRSGLVKQLVMTLGGLLNELGTEAVGEVGTSLVAGVRTLRRVGLRWLGMQGLLQSEKAGLDRTIAAAKVSTLCEQVVREMEAVVSEFERHIGPAAPQADRARHAA